MELVLPEISGCCDKSKQIFTNVAGGAHPLIAVDGRIITCDFDHELNEHLKINGAFVPKNGRLYYGGDRHWVALATFTEDHLIALANWCQTVNHQLGARLPRNVQWLDLESDAPVPA